MIRGLGLTDYFANSQTQKQTFSYTLKTKKVMAGPLRSIQKFVVILLTSKGTDPIRPWFGTKLNKLTRMNVSNKETLQDFVNTECSDAITQFFRLQAEEAEQNAQTGIDVINSIELIKYELSSSNRITLIFRFVPLKTGAIMFSIDYNM